jgi:membrane associated rhomboid family serine protease
LRSAEPFRAALRPENPFKNAVRRVGTGLDVPIRVAFLPLLILGGLVVYFLTPDERIRVLRRTVHAMVDGAGTIAHHFPDSQPFREALRGRTRWVVVVPAVIAVQVAIFGAMLVGSGHLGDPATLIAWGASFGPRTTNGEWWRLATALFVHAGLLHLIVNVIGLAQVGAVVERLVGHVTFALVYFAAGIFAGLLSLSASPIGVNSAASAAVYGVYGLFLASIVWGVIDRSELTIPLLTLKRVAPSAALFILFCWASTGFTRTDMVGLVIGAGLGAALELGISVRKPPVRRLAIAVGSTFLVCLACAFPLRGVTDVRSDLQRVAAVEEQTAREYQTAVGRFHNGVITANNLTELIDHTIVPEIRTLRARLKGLQGVPPEHQRLVAAADEYLRLRDQSWQLRIDGLRKTNMGTLREAERVERASFAFLEKVRTFDGTSAIIQ